MVVPDADRDKWWLGDAAPKSQSKGKGKRKASAPTKKKLTNRAKARKNTDDDEKDSKPLPPHQKTTFPVVITTYEMVIKDRDELAAYRWGFIVVDEGHRLKNMDCKLIRELKSLTADARMVLTGTPLHVSTLLLLSPRSLTCCRII